jgi:hypothetical protein
MEVEQMMATNREKNGRQPRNVGQNGNQDRRKSKEMKEVRTNQAKADTTLKEMKELTARLEAKIEAEIKTNN